MYLNYVFHYKQLEISRMGIRVYFQSRIRFSGNVMYSYFYLEELTEVIF